MNALIASRPRRVGWAVLAFLLATAVALVFSAFVAADTIPVLSNGDTMKRLLAMPALFAVATLALLSACAQTPAASAALLPAPVAAAPSPFMAQVVGVQWLNPLQRRDYSTEWQLLWTLGLAAPNQNDDMVRTDPKMFSTLQSIGGLAAGNDGTETFVGFHHKYVDQLIQPYHDKYFSSSRYFYNAHSVRDKRTRRELAGMHIEYALPALRLDPELAASHVRAAFEMTFMIGNPNFPTAWSSSAPPDVRVTTGGPNAGFTSLGAAIDYLQAHPDQTVWAMNWDSPSYPPKEDQLNENIVLLVLAGPHYKTERAALAWIGRPVDNASATFAAQERIPAVAVAEAWRATLAGAAANAGKSVSEIGYVIHDANSSHPDSGERMRHLAHVLALDVPAFDYMKQAFNTPSILGDMGAGTALTNVALGIAYANHFGKNVLVAGTTDPAHATAVLVTPPETVRPVMADKPWFRARGENNAYLMWWGIRHDETFRMQGYSN